LKNSPNFQYHKTWKKGEKENPHPPPLPFLQQFTTPQILKGIINKMFLNFFLGGWGGGEHLGGLGGFTLLPPSLACSISK